MIINGIQATTTVPVREVLLWVLEFLLVSDFLRDLLDIFQLFSFASSNSICSCLHSLLQNGVFPLYMYMSVLYPRDFLQRKQASRKWVSLLLQSSLPEKWNIPLDMIKKMKMKMRMNQKIGFRNEIFFV